MKLAKHNHFDISRTCLDLISLSYKNQIWLNVRRLELKRDINTLHLLNHSQTIAKNCEIAEISSLNLILKQSWLWHFVCMCLCVDIYVYLLTLITRHLKTDHNLPTYTESHIKISTTFREIFHPKMLSWKNRIHEQSINPLIFTMKSVKNLVQSQR